MIIEKYNCSCGKKLKETEYNASNSGRIIEVRILSKGFDACSKDMKSMSNKLGRLLEAAEDWMDDEDSDVLSFICKALEEAVKKFQSDVEFCIRSYRIVDKEEQLDLTIGITNLINKAKLLINTEDYKNE